MTELPSALYIREAFSATSAGESCPEVELSVSFILRRAETILFKCKTYTCKFSVVGIFWSLLKPVHFLFCRFWYELAADLGKGMVKALP